jgi:hypothetical protein
MHSRFHCPDFVAEVYGVHTSVGAVGDLGVKADRADGSAALGPILDVDIVGASIVPGEANHDGVGVGLVHKVPESLLAALELLHVLGGGSHEERNTLAATSGGRKAAGAELGAGDGRAAHTSAGEHGGGGHEGISASGESQTKEDAAREHGRNEFLFHLGRQEDSSIRRPPRAGERDAKFNGNHFRSGCLSVSNAVFQ